MSELYVLRAYRQRDSGTAVNALQHTLYYGTTSACDLVLELCHPSNLVK